MGRGAMPWIIAILTLLFDNGLNLNSLDVRYWFYAIVSFMIAELRPWSSPIYKTYM